MNVMHFPFNDPHQITVYHASDKVVAVDDIILPGPRSICDFGPGFYITPNKLISEEWVAGCSNPIINSYELNLDANDVFHLANEDWIRVIVGFRKCYGNISLVSNIVKGLIADDRLMISLNNFLNGLIGDIRLLKALDYCNLGNQYAIRLDKTVLREHSFEPLVGIELQNAIKRSHDRRKNMDSYLRNLVRNPVYGEKYVEDYERLGDFIE